MTNLLDGTLILGIRTDCQVWWTQFIPCLQVWSDLPEVWTGKYRTDIKVHSFDDVMNTNRTGVKSGCISTDVIHAKLFFWVSFIK